LGEGDFPDLAGIAAAFAGDDAAPAFAGDDAGGAAGDALDVAGAAGAVGGVVPSGKIVSW